MQLCPRVSKNELSANRGQKTGKGKPDKASRILPVVIGSNRGRASALIKEKSQAVSKRGKGVARGTTSVSNTSVEPPLVSKSQPKTSQIEKGGGRGKGRGKGSSKTTNVSLNNCSVNSHVDSEIKVGKGGTRGRGSSSTSLKQSPLSPSLCIPIAKSAQATQLGKPVGKARGFSNIKEASLISQFLKSPITNSPNTPQSRNVSRRGRGRGINTTSKKQLQVSPSVCDYEDNTPDTPQIKRGSVKGKVSGNTPINKRSLVSSSLSNQLPNSPQSPQFVSSGSPYSGIIGVVQILSPGRDEESTSPKLQKSSSKIRGRSRGTSAAVIPQNYIEIKPIQLNAQKLFKVPVSNLTNLSSSQIIPQASPVLFTTSTRRTKVTPHKNMTTHGSLTNPATLPQVTDPVSSAVLKRQTGVHQQGRVATRKSSKTPVKKDSVDGQKENAPAVGIKNATAGQPDSSIHTKAHHTRARLVSRRERGMVHRLKEGIPSTKGISSKIIDSSIGTRFRGSIGRGHRPGKGRLRLGSLQAAGQSLVNDRDCDSIVRRSRRDRKVTEKFKEFKENETKVAAKQNSGTSSEIEGSIPIISSVVSLAPQTGPEINNFSTPVSNKAITPSPRGTQTTPSPRGTQTINVTQTVPKGTTGVQTKVTQQIIIQPPAPKPVKNKSVLCRPYTQTKATSCRPHTQTKETQTDENMGKPVLIPVPVPIYVPVPMRMYTTPVPHPMPIPVPIPFPCFIPTTKKNTESILKHVKEIQERIPADPFEAELLRMAEAVAKADDESDSDTSDDDGEAAGGIANEIPDQIPENQDEPPQEFGEDMLQMALRMASEMPDENVVAMDNSLSSTPGITESEYTDPPTLQSSVTPSPRRGRGKRRGGSTGGRGRPKKIKLEDTSEDPPAETPAPDENSMLKYTYGVNAWKHWVTNKNAEIARASTTNRGKVKPFKMEILQCTADELNFALCLFVKEVRKPNGEEYAPDSIYYLCLGIQAYIFEKARIDNIFTDIYFERFTDTLNEVLENYEVRLNAQGLIVCRIEEEHLWEAKQLGAHSPHVLLNTLVYFNTKFFMLKTTEDHLNLSFSHIMKHWKKTQLPGRQGTGRSVYLRYYAPTAAENTPKRKKEEAPVYEQAENLDNPLRCPVKLYEFYLSKCPESIKNRNDVFYLIPERSCVPDSPVWYSTGSLGEPSLSKMLNRIRWVRETQEAHLHNQPLFLPS